MRWTIALLVTSVSSAAAQEPPDTNYDESKVPKYELPDPLICFDGRKVTVSRNDVLYTTPSVEPWEAMPVGGGDLCAMVRSDATGLDLHLTKSDAWGFQAPPDAPPGSRFFNNVSPGHVRLQFGEGARAAATEQFRQRLDLYHGRIVLRFGRDPDDPRLEVWGHPERKILVVEVSDPRDIT